MTDRGTSRPTSGHVLRLGASVAYFARNEVRPGDVRRRLIHEQFDSAHVEIRPGRTDRRQNRSQLARHLLVLLVERSLGVTDCLGARVARITVRAFRRRIASSKRRAYSSSVAGARIASVVCACSTTKSQRPSSIRRSAFPRRQCSSSDKPMRMRRRRRHRRCRQPRLKGGGNPAGAQIAAALGEIAAAFGKTTAPFGEIAAASGKTTAASGKTTAASGETTAALGKTTAAFGKTTAASGKTTAAFGKTTAILDSREPLRR